MKQYIYTRGLATVVLCTISLLGSITETEARGGGNVSKTDIHACVHKKTGKTRIVGRYKKCRKREIATHWAIAGPAGTDGQDGADGSSAPIHMIGDDFGGGIVFLVDANGEHGLIAAKADQGTDIQWWNGKLRFTGATGDGVGAGSMNTTIIIATQIGDNPRGDFAAKLAADYRVQEDGVTPCTRSVIDICYADWYLPSLQELKLMFAQANVVGGLNEGSYWSSVEIVTSDDEDPLGEGAWSLFLPSGTQEERDKRASLRVRVIRAF